MMLSRENAITSPFIIVGASIQPYPTGMERQDTPDLHEAKYMLGNWLCICIWRDPFTKEGD